MSKYRRAAKVDRCQAGIVRELRKAGMSVVVGHDDILVGYKNPWSGQKTTYWYELKEPSCVSKKTGRVRESELKPSQKKLLATYKGHYRVVWEFWQILNEIVLDEIDPNTIFPDEDLAKWAKL